MHRPVITKKGSAMDKASIIVMLEMFGGNVQETVSSYLQRLLISMHSQTVSVRVDSSSYLKCLMCLVYPLKRKVIQCNYEAIYNAALKYFMYAMYFLAIVICRLHFSQQPRQKPVVSCRCVTSTVVLHGSRETISRRRTDCRR